MKKNLRFLSLHLFCIFFNNSLDFLINMMDIMTYITDKIVFAGLKRGSIDQNYNESSCFHRIRDSDCGGGVYSSPKDSEYAKSRNAAQ
jgi:hypothetical protein